MNKVLKQDLDEIVRGNFIIKEFDKTTVMITGITGLIGSCLAKSFLYCNEVNGTNIKVIGICRNRDKAYKLFDAWIEDENLEIMSIDIINLKDVAQKVDYIFHGASITDSRAFVTKPVETINIAIKGTENILEIAKKQKVKGMVYLSSLEVYGIINSPLTMIKEAESGNIDVTSIRSSYAESKRMVECLCCAYAAEYNVPVRIGRLTQTFGSGIDYNDNRVFAQFIKAVINEQNITLHTTGDTSRAYVYISDAVLALMYIVLRGNDGEAYNISNPSTFISISDMANLVVDQFGSNKSKVEYMLTNDINEKGYNPTIKINLSIDKIQQLGWKPKIDLNEMYKRAIDYLKLEIIEKVE